ncbi:MAG: hypothetical protein ACJ8FS_00910 [Sphingomicrobium sp.]
MNIEKLDGVDEETLPVLGHVMAAFSEAYSGLGAVHTARDAAKGDPTLNEAAQIIKTQDLADRIFSKVAQRMDGSRASLVAGIAHLEKEMMQPVESRASHPVSQEIRAHIKGLPSGERMGFIKQAIDAADHDTAMAALGAPAYLSGIEAGMQASLLKLYREKANPAMAKRLKAMTSAKALIEDRGGLVLKEMEKAVGLPPHKVQRLRQAKSKSEQAFVLKDIG